jgi:hypothetical protein
VDTSRNEKGGVYSLTITIADQLSIQRKDSLFQKRSTTMTKKNLMLMTLVAILVFAQATVVFADTGGPDVFVIKDVGPVFGHTEPARPLALLWPWLALTAVVATGATVVALKRRAA